MKKFVNRFLCFLSNLFYPEHITCNLCGAELNKDSQSDICEYCEAHSLPFIKSNICLSCGEPINDMSSFCIRCKSKQPKFVMARAPFLYDNSTKMLIHQFKEHGKKYLVKTLAFYMAQTYINNKMNADIITYVPMSIKRKKQRGFNQSYLLAKELSQRLSIPFANEELVKVKDTPHQTGMTFLERQKNLKDSFDVKSKNNFKNKAVLLIDDVYTTGATINECTSILLKKGKAKSVLVLTVCHTTIK